MQACPCVFLKLAVVVEMQVDRNLLENMPGHTRWGKCVASGPSWLQYDEGLVVF